ncbi:MAG: FAD-dependent oxidoreductase [Archangium sp.]|nr:FAD-dependent oxidoreductase [Archangium sp.]
MIGLLISLGVVLVLVLTWRFHVKWLVRWRLGAYRRAVNHVDVSKPEKLSAPKRVAVLGGGVAGISAASTLAARGYEVTIFEAKDYLGGKLGSWKVTHSNGTTEWASHGFHAFFRHYYNLNRFLDSLGLRKSFKAISDYRILFPGGDELSFGEIDTTPILNMVSLAKHGVYKFGETMRAPTRDLMGILLEYDAKTTFAQLDHVSFAQFDEVAKLPARLKLAFNTFARVFFADEHKLSMAELIKSFHFYFLGHDGGLGYDHPTADYEASLLIPLRAHLSSLGVKLLLATPVTQLERATDGTFLVNGGSFDRVVCATDVVGTRAILSSARGLEGLNAELTKLEPGQRYAVLRLWIDKAARAGLPVFVITDRVRLLDSITFYDRTERESADWVKKHGGSVIELHSYAVPDDVTDADVRAALLDEVLRFLPELQGFVVKEEHFQLRRDFTAFHVGQYASRPGTDSGVRGLVCAGDWVKLPFASMLLEAACSSGLVAANSILSLDGLRETLVEAVPPRGLLAGTPAPPTRKPLLARLDAMSREQRPS